MPAKQGKRQSDSKHGNSIGALEWVRVGASSHILQAKSEEMPQVQCKGESSVSHSIGAMDCYVTVQASGKRLTDDVAELPLIVQVMRLTTTVLPVPPFA